MTTTLNIQARTIQTVLGVAIGVLLFGGLQARESVRSQDEPEYISASDAADTLVESVAPPVTVPVTVPYLDTSEADLELMAFETAKVDCRRALRGMDISTRRLVVGSPEALMLFVDEYTEGFLRGGGASVRPYVEAVEAGCLRGLLDSV